MVNSFVRLAAAFLGVVTLAGCAGSEAAITAPPGVPAATSCGEVNIAVNPWSGYAANVAVVKYLLEQEVGCTVGAIELSETSSWAGLADGSIDVILENWGHDDLKKKYIDRQKVAVELGLTGNKGVIGWYVPPWMAKTYPDITDWTKLNDYAELFQTAESGEKGQFLAGDPSFVTNDATLIKNLKLDYTVVYAGSEDKLIAAFRKAQTKKTPLIGYFYEPQWLLSDIKLVHIPLPNYTPGCDAVADAVACDYQPYDLDKIGRKAFVDSGSPAATFLKNWTWTNADQNAVAKDMTKGLTAEQAARKWADAHRTTWEKWLP
ncbi:glycine betaine/proline transport system substrate-binding protein [Actinoplanes lutulentus]|uniref:Glycine betaine/proline transport system substrate-binding protein n=1 Tax=Actinoplanes lutulentus TaxID=1287878 RepID=A0A327ZI75_9ACTN|nr:ABC transporter substrate-binding protein [Actinoplanes lutulentus]MBB2946877.1 glycine betaine/proline transport system substrate-binding protein [Actinoplanes lutulentus]RAK35771.1 glycine betaine/proline transport system substrate-binding protein [Actinoplanes lutulentus]